MKFRSDFVTNSSSSSFVMAFKDGNDKPHMIVNKLLDYVGDCYETSPAEIMTSEKDVEHVVRESYGYGNMTLKQILDEDPSAMEYYKTCCEYLEKGYKIAEKQIAYSDETLIDMFKIVADGNDDFVILEDMV